MLLYIRNSMNISKLLRITLQDQDILDLLDNRNVSNIGSIDTNEFIFLNQEFYQLMKCFYSDKEI